MSKKRSKDSLQALVGKKVRVSMKKGAITDIKLVGLPPPKLKSKGGERVEFIVSLIVPEGATRREAKEYISEAVRSWSGSLQPPGADLGDGTSADGDPMFDLNPDSVWVTFRSI